MGDRQIKMGDSRAASTSSTTIENRGAIDRRTENPTITAPITANSAAAAAAARKISPQILSSNLPIKAR